MSDVSQQISQALTGGQIKQLSQQLNIDEQSTQNAVQAALPMLMGAMAKRSNNTSSAQKMLSMFDFDKDGDILDDMSGFLSSSNNRMGPNILSEVFGGKRNNVESGLGKVAGIDAGKAGMLLENLAPIVLGMLMKNQRSQQGEVNPGDLSDMLNKEASNISAGDGSSIMDMMSGFLDQDKDGSMVDDVAGMLGKFLK